MNEPKITSFESEGTPLHLAGTSENAVAQALFGHRMEGRNEKVLVLFAPIEQDYTCPVHQQSIDDEQQHQTLFWSEYNCFVWCSLCDKDYPSALCLNADVPVDRKIKIYLDTVQFAVNRASREGKDTEA